MKNARFKVGDKVRILDGSKIRHFAGTWNKCMTQYVGETTEIIRTTDHYPYPEQIGYKVKGNSFTWDERSLAPVCDETIVIYQNGQEVIALNKATGKKAVAKCSPSDTFDFTTGARLAFDRLTTPKPSEKKRTPIFKIGDRVRLKDGLRVGQQYGGLTLYPNMHRGFPRIAIIEDITCNGHYKVEDYGYWFSEEMLEFAPKFKVGDQVIGNAEASRKYFITMKGWRGRVIAVREPKNVGEDDIRVEGNDGAGPFWVESKYFDLDTTPEYYNGKVVSLRNGGCFTQGKIYECKNGKLIDDDHDGRPTSPKRFLSFEELDKFYRNQFIEVVE